MVHFVLSTFACIAGIAIIHWLHNQYHLDIAVTPTLFPPPYPLISIIVPARNEERNIRRCVEALLAQIYPNLEFVLVDDRSTDATPQILAELAARDPRLRLVRGAELPTDWAGKSHALWQGVSAVRGDWLCFMDADTFAAPLLISSVYATSQKYQSDLFTIMTTQEMGTFWEKTVLPLVLTALSVGFSPRRVNDPNKPDAIANGQFILIRREVYEKIGGHAAIKGSIVEDRDLAQRVKRAGYRLVIADGRALARTRMYTSLPEMWEGWTKNIFIGLRAEAGLMLLGVFGALLNLTAALALPFWSLAGMTWLVAGGGWQAALVMVESLLVWGYLLWMRALAARDLGISPLYAFTTPLGAAVFAALMLASAYKVLSGQGVMWKGRRYHGS